MAFPISLDNFSEVQDNVDDVMAVDINELQTAIEAIEAKIGINASEVATSLEYRLTNFLPTTPANPETKFLNGNKLWSEISIGSGGYSANVYPSEVASDVSGYKTLSYILDAAETVKSIVVNNNTVLSENCIYGVTAGVDLIPAGTWKANFYVKVSSTIGDTVLKAQVFLRHADNSETDLFEMTSPTIENTADYAILRFESSQSAFAILATDRIGVRIKGATTRTLNTTIDYIIGNGRGAYFTTPLQIRHNQLRGLNEDTNYLHITSVEKASFEDKMDNPMTDAGDIIYGGTAGLATALPKGTDGQILTMVSGLPTWDDPSGSVPEAGVAVSNGSDWDASLQVIDPANPIAQSAGYLVGGSNHSALSVFQALASGANNGKFKINVDGTVYDNIGISLSVPSQIITADSNYQDNVLSGVSRMMQSFTVPTGGGVIGEIEFRGDNYGGIVDFLVAEIFVADANNKPTGSIIATSELDTTLISRPAHWQEQKIPSFNTYLPAGKYVMTFRLKNKTVNGGYCVIINNANTSTYSGGENGYSSDDGVTWTVGTRDLSLKINWLALSYSSLASILQAAIRTATGKTETVIYDTNHFKITSSVLGRSSKILKLMSPSTGTDISGAGATPYLDCAANAIETPGNGEDGKLVILSSTGLINYQIVPYSYVASDNILSQALTERSTTSTSYVKVKEITIKKTGIFRILFSLKAANINYGVAGTIYKNGVAFGTVRNTTGTSYIVFSEDLAFSAGDKVQLYYLCSNAGYAASTKDFKVCGSLAMSDTFTVGVD